MEQCALQQPHEVATALTYLYLATGSTFLGLKSSFASYSPTQKLTPVHRAGNAGFCYGGILMAEGLNYAVINSFVMLEMYCTMCAEAPSMV
jgi:hypothetical protein